MENFEEADKKSGKYKKVLTIKIYDNCFVSFSEQKEFSATKI